MSMSSQKSASGSSRKRSPRSAASVLIVARSCSLRQVRLDRADAAEVVAGHVLVEDAEAGPPPLELADQRDQAQRVADTFLEEIGVGRERILAIALEEQVRDESLEIGFGHRRRASYSTTFATPRRLDTPGGRK